MVPIPEGVERYDQEEDDRHSSVGSVSSGSYTSSQEVLDQPACGAPTQRDHGVTAPAPGLARAAMAGAGAATAMKGDGVRGLCELSGC